MLAVLGVLALALIVGAYFFGQSQEKKKYDAGEPAYNAIYTAGAKSGNAAGTASGAKQGKEEGVTEGTQKGKQSGLAQGKSEGETTGQKSGANAALGGLGSWSTSTPYVVQMEPGPNAQVPFAVQDRTQMQQGLLYKVCSNGSSICTESAAGATGAGN